MRAPQTLLEAVSYFADLDVCHEYMTSIRWPSGTVTCPNCGGDKIGRIRSRRLFQCKENGCRRQFSAKVGTIFEDGPLPLDKWFVSVWCIVNAKNGISSHELSKAIGVSQKSCWHMLHRIRAAMKTKSFKKISGTVESDESCIGGLAKNMHKDVKARKITGTGGKDKTIVHGILERPNCEGGKSRVDVKVVPDRRASTLQPPVREHVEPGTRICTDEAVAYRGLDDAYVHELVDHLAEQYVRDGDVHTNSMENFWTLLKHSLKGTFVCATPQALGIVLRRTGDAVQRALSQ